MHRGVIYLSTKSPVHASECLHSVKTLKKYNPNLPVTLFTDDEHANDEIFDNIILIRDKIHPLKTKVNYLLHSPYDATLYLDTDTEITGDISGLFDLLEDHDFAIGRAVKVDFSQKPPKFEAFHHKENFNTGVFLFKKTPATELFIKEWKTLVDQQDEETMRPGYFCDQYCFNQVIKDTSRQSTDLALTIFDNRVYNATKWIYEQLGNREKKEVKIKHWHGLQLSPLEKFLKKNLKLLRNIPIAKRYVAWN